MPRGNCPRMRFSLSSGIPPCICGSFVASENVPSQPKIAAEDIFSLASAMPQILLGVLEFSERWRIKALSAVARIFRPPQNLGSTEQAWTRAFRNLRYRQGSQWLAEDRLGLARLGQSLV